MKKRLAVLVMAAGLVCMSQVTNASYIPYSASDDVKYSGPSTRINSHSRISIFDRYSLTRMEWKDYFNNSRRGQHILRHYRHFRQHHPLQPPVISAVPIPAAVWLFGSGLIGLVVVARRKLA